MKFKDAKYPVLIGTTHIPELNAIQVRPGIRDWGRGS
jgi:hypothetical protein